MKSVPNTFKVPKRQWRKWSERARHVFNELFSSMKGNQTIFLHPQQEKLSVQKWRTVAWNAAWIAADAVREYDKSARAKGDPDPVIQRGEIIEDLTRSGRVARTHKLKPSAAAALH